MLPLFGPHFISFGKQYRFSKEHAHYSFQLVFLVDEFVHCYVEIIDDGGIVDNDLTVRCHEGEKHFWQFSDGVLAIPLMLNVAPCAAVDILGCLCNGKKVANER